jgi:UDP-2-acetamido-3-amino-2,3-dideoxy-glucuronate N-acetyltransferase
MKFRNGINAHIFVSWLHPFKEQKLVVVGEKSMAVFNDIAQDKLIKYNHEIKWINGKPVSHSNTPEIIKIDNTEPLKLECLDFINRIFDRKQTRVNGEKGLQVLKVLAKCQESLTNNGKLSTISEDKSNFFAHKSSIIESPNLSIGENTKVWHFSHIMPKAKIGKNCNIGQNVFIGDNVKIGNGVKIQNNVSIFDGVEIEDDVFLAPSCVFTNDKNPRSFKSKNGQYMKTIVKKGATVGANATVICGIIIGKYAFIGAGAVVTKNVSNYGMVYGNPAMPKGFICECGGKITNQKGKYSCLTCNNFYKVKDGNLEKYTND